MEKRKYYTIRPSYLYHAKHFNDVYLNLGYNYKGKLFKNGSSPQLFANPLQTSMLNSIEGMIFSLIEHAKYVKKWFSIAHEQNTTNIS